MYIREFESIKSFKVYLFAHNGKFKDNIFISYLFIRLLNLIKMCKE